MTEAEIRAALAKHLDGIEDHPVIIWANRPQPISADALTLIVQFVPTSRQGLTLSGTATAARGFMQVTVASPLSQFDAAALTMGDTIAARFPKALRLTEGGTSIEITAPPTVGQGYPDGGHWRLPVRIDYLALSA